MEPTPPLSDEERYKLAASFYRAPRVLTAALTALVVIQIGAIGTKIAGYVYEWQVIATGSQEGPTLDAADLAISTADQVRLVAYLAALVVFCVWLHRMYRNLPSLGSNNLRYTPGGAVGSFFIPLVNMVRGYQVMNHLWNESQPLPSPRPTGITLRSSALIGWWWTLHMACYLANTLLGNGGTAPSLDAWLSASRRTVVLLVAVAVDGLVFLVVVRGIARRQRDQWDDITRRQPQPQKPDRPL
jgi:hypothetical protein